jgi:nudix-type nucleoside diphosphatase (YffH/AdpP family)
MIMLPETGRSRQPSSGESVPFEFSSVLVLGVHSGLNGRTCRALRRSANIPILRGNTRLRTEFFVYIYDMKPQIIDTHLVYEGYLNVEKFRIRLSSGVIVSRDIERHGDAAAVLPYDAERRSALLARLFRAPVFSVTGEVDLEEACAGMIENESDEDTPRREAYEELGVRLHAVERVARIWSSPGVSTERQSLFLAAYVHADLPMASS